MKQIATKLMSLCIATVTFGSALMLPGALDAIKSKADTGVKYTTPETYWFSDKNRGYYTEPVADGTYQTVVLIHGQDDWYASWLAQQMPKAMESWTAAGYLEPVNIVFPWITPLHSGDSYHIYGHKEFALDYTGELGKNIENITGKADTKKYKTAIAGYSLGGDDCLTAAAKYPDVYQEVGSLSPSCHFNHKGNESADYNHFKSIDEMNFNPETRGFVSYGVNEPSLFPYDGDHYYDILYNKFNLKSSVKYACKDSRWGGHCKRLFLSEIFMYLTFLQTGKIPSEELTEKACGKIYLDNGYFSKLAEPVKHNPSKKTPADTALSVSDTVSTKTNVVHGDSYTVSVTAKGGKTGSYTYDWQYSTKPDSGFSSTILKDKEGNSLNGRSSLTISSASRDVYYRCKVSDGSSEPVFSKPVKINVAPNIHSITSDGYGVALKPNATYKITVNATCGDNMTYMWEYSTNGSTWIKSTNKGYNTKTATYVNREENHLKTIYYRCTVTCAGSKSTATIKLGK